MLCWRRAMRHASRDAVLTADWTYRADRFHDLHCSRSGDLLVIAHGMFVTLVDIPSFRLRTQHCDSDVEHVAVSPDGSRVSVTSGDNLQIRARESLRLLATTTSRMGEILSVDWSADSKTICVGCMGGLAVFDDAGQWR